MAQPFAFDFGDRFFLIRDREIAFRVYTEANVYTPYPDSMEIQECEGGLLIRADRFAWGGVQQSCAGIFQAKVVYMENGLSIQVSATLHERIKGSAVFIRDVRSGEIAGPNFQFSPIQNGYNDVLKYPSPLKMPVFILRHEDGQHTVAWSEDTQVRSKAFAIVPGDSGWLLELQHHEDARKWSENHESPIWRVGQVSDPGPVLEERMEMMEKAWGLQTWETRKDVPDWTRQIGLVLNLHGMHWTGFVFNDYARQLEILQRVCQKIEGRHVLVFLAAWDGRYNFNWPRYEADERMGGAEGLRQLVEGAHALGVHVIPQVGAVSANKAFLPPALHSSGFQDAYGNTYVKDNEWDNDRAPDTYRINANIGHPGFRQFLLDKICGLKRDYDFDGIFIDINMGFENDPRFHPTEGHVALAKSLHERFDDFLLFGENWYDGLLPAYPLVHPVSEGTGLRQWGHVFEKYARMTFHLTHPAPGKGSTGVYEAGYIQPSVPDPEANVIPAISFVDDTLENYENEIDLRIESARNYLRRKKIQ